MTRPPPPEVGLCAVEFWRVLFAVSIGVMCTALIAWTLYLELG